MKDTVESNRAAYQALCEPQKMHMSQIEKDMAHKEVSMKLLLLSLSQSYSGAQV